MPLPAACGLHATTPVCHGPTPASRAAAAPSAGEGRQFTTKMSVGCALALLGFCLYSHTKVVAYRRQQLQQLRSSGLEAACVGAAGGGIPAIRDAKKAAAWQALGGGEYKSVPLLAEDQRGRYVVLGTPSKPAPATVEVIVQAGSPAKGPLYNLHLAHIRHACAGATGGSRPASPTLRIKAGGQ